MSWQQIEIAFNKEVPSDSPGRKSTKVLALVALAEYANETGTDNIWPEMAQLAWKIGCSERHAQDIVTELRNDGVIIPIKQFRSGTYSYKFNWNAYANKKAYEKPTRPNWKPGFRMKKAAKSVVHTDRTPVLLPTEPRFISRQNPGSDEPFIPGHVPVHIQEQKSDITSGLKKNGKDELGGIQSDAENGLDSLQSDAKPVDQPIPVALAADASPIPVALVVEAQERRERAAYLRRVRSMERG